MKSKKLTVTIGIPAFNEEANIGFLLKDVLMQKTNSFKLTNILVSSDGSTDKTKFIVEAFKDKRIKLLANIERKGQSYRQNQIMNISKTDILVLINADIALKDKDFLEKLIKVFKSKNADLVSSNLVATYPRTFTEKVLGISQLFKNSIFEHYRFGDNLYTCHGAVRAFSKNLYKTMRFKQSIAEDAYSYLFVKKNNLNYQYAKNAVAYYKLPENISDHKKQSARFFHSKKFLYLEFGKKFTDTEYKLPFKKMLKTYLTFFVRSPIEMIIYSAIVIVMRLESFLAKDISNTWDVAQSSKAIRSI